MRSPVAFATITSAAVLACAGCSGGSSGGYGSASSATAAARTSTTASSDGARIATADTRLGTILVAGPQGRTLYAFTADHGPASSCSGACAQVWPPLTTSGAPAATGGALAAELSVITRPDGTRQVTYAGHPLYYFQQDTASGDTFGQGITGFGGRWYAIKPDGGTVHSDSSPRAARHKHPSNTPAAQTQATTESSSSSTTTTTSPYSQPGGGYAPAGSSTTTHTSTAPVPMPAGSQGEATTTTTTTTTPAPRGAGSEAGSGGQSGGGIPQGNGGDHDGDNSGGPSDGDGDL